MTPADRTPRDATDPTVEGPANPWPALLALLTGFFMILVDTTIVTVAIPHIMRGLETDINAVIWVTSAYLLAYAVPLLVTGRLGDRFGPKPVFLVGLVLFTLSSLWCGLASTISMLIVARIAQGLGGALMTPQTMAVITRTFPPRNRGAAMGLWGGIAGLAMLVGPLLGGWLTETAGWSWIFFINLPVGVLSFVLVARFVPRLTTHAHRFDWLGMVLSGAAMFCLVFGVQEGEQFGWGAMPVDLGAATVEVPVLAVIGAGIVLLAAFVWWQARNRHEPLVPLGLFRDRNFALANVAISVIGFVVTAMGVPLILYTQTGRGLTATESALLMLPMAVASGVLAPFVGRYVQTRDARLVTVGGFVLMGLALAWSAALMRPETATGWFFAPMTLLGIASACLWGPVSVNATRNLPARDAGAGASVYNTTRQIGAVLGSAAISAMITARLTAELGPGAAQASGADLGSALPPFVVEPFGNAMAQAMLLPAAMVVLGAIAVACWERPAFRVGRSDDGAESEARVPAVAE